MLGKFGVPYLTFPFNILAIVTFLAFQTNYPETPQTTDAETFSNQTTVMLGSMAVSKNNKYFVLNICVLLSDIGYILILIYD